MLSKTDRIENDALWMHRVLSMNAINGEFENASYSFVQTVD